MPGQRHSSPLWLRWAKGVCVFWCNLPPALLTEWQASFLCHCGNMGLNRYRIRVSTDSYLWRRNFPAAPPRFELTTFRSRVRRSNQQTIPALTFGIINKQKQISDQNDDGDVNVHSTQSDDDLRMMTVLKTSLPEEWQWWTVLTESKVTNALKMMIRSQFRKRKSRSRMTTVTRI